MNATEPLWNRYEGFVDEWNLDQRSRAVIRYRREREKVAPVAPKSILDDYQVTPASRLPAPAPTPDFEYRPVVLPTKPADATLGDALVWGVGGGAVTALVWTAMMAEGWRSGSGHVLPALIVIGLVLAVLGGAATAAVRYAVRKNRFKTLMPRYAAAADQAARAVSSQQLVAEQNRLAKMDDDSDRLLWARIQNDPAAIEATANDAAEELSDEAILAEFDAQTPERVEAVLTQAQQEGIAPESTNGWLEGVAASIKRTADAIEAMQERGWDVQVTESGPLRDLAQVTGDELPAPTTVVFHNATPDQLKAAEEHIAAYSDADLSYRPIPGADHSVPTGLPSRVVHVNTHWTTLGLDEVEDGYGVIGSQAYLTDWDHLIDTIATAEL